jgi:4-hydroxy-tetrahydrodipicolinate reductase
MTVTLADVPVVTAPLPHPESVVSPLRIGLIGFGRTGREVASSVLKDEHASLAWVLRRSSVHVGRSAADLLGVDAVASATVRSMADTDVPALLRSEPVDALIDFGAESALHTYGDAAADAGVAVVSAVSHYSDAAHRHLARMSERTAVLWSPNITLGVNFLLVAAQALRRMAPDADVQVLEEHFAGKQGASGTALRIVETLGIPLNALHSVRAGGIVGVHETLFGFPSQCVRIRHESLSREAFGEGALFAARQVRGREPGLYRMEDLLQPYFREHEPPPATPRVPQRMRGRVASRLRRWAAALD